MCTPPTRPQAGPGATSWREVALALAGGLALAIALSWPLVLHLGRDVLHDTGDPLLQMWQLAWGGHALLHQPLDPWDANLLFPNSHTLGFTDSLLGYAPFGLIGDGVGAAIVRYNLVWLLAGAMAFAGPYTLARELGLGRPAAVVAGVAFACSPWRWDQANHLHVLSSGPIAFSLALLVRGYFGGRPRAVVGGFAVAAWMMLIAASLGVMLAWLLAGVAAVAGGRWLVRGRPRFPRPLVLATVLGGALFVGVSAWVAGAYRDVQREQPRIVRSEYEVSIYSPKLKSFLAAPADNTLWGNATGRFREGFARADEVSLFLGLTVMALAVVGLTGGALPLRWRLAIAGAGLLAAIISLGFGLFDGAVTWRPLRAHVPGFETSRTPGRWHTLTTLAVALLAAGGAQRLLAALAARRPVGPRLVAVVAGVLAALIAAEGAAFSRPGDARGAFAGPAHPVVPRPPPGLGDVAGPRIHLPPELPTVHRYMLWSVDGFPRIVNGLLGFDPDSVLNLRATLPGFPDRASVAALRALGVERVVLHPDLAAGTPWQDAAARPIGGLGIARSQGTGFVVYELSAGR